MMYEVEREAFYMREHYGDSQANTSAASQSNFAYNPQYLNQNFR